MDEAREGEEETLCRSRRPGGGLPRRREGRGGDGVVARLWLRRLTAMDAAAGDLYLPWERDSVTSAMTCASM